MSIVYLSGPMSGHEDFNFPAFNGAALVLRSRGYAVINPAENFGGICKYDRETYMRADIGHVLAAGIVIVLPGWQGSVGARTEVQVAFQCGTPVYTFEEFTSKKYDFSEIKPFDLTDSTKTRQGTFEHDYTKGVYS
jgi:hypothetical protein